MARKKKASTARDAIKEEVRLELTPMIDVTFLILIFFMCTLKFKTLEGKLVSYLPTDKGLSAAKAEIEFEDAEIILKIPKEEWEKKSENRMVIFLRNGSNTPFGRCLGMRPIEGNEKNMELLLEPPGTLIEIQKYLNEVRKGSPESKAKINAYSRTPHYYVVDILNRMIDAGFTDISYSGIPQSLLRDLQNGTIK
ncbi:MAG: hypothetical protein CL908_11850 [Deltaproteobacteria bacterium]|nr:hypothetical protein [Deltaproteobacteria bacterium]